MKITSSTLLREAANHHLLDRRIDPDRLDSEHKQSSWLCVALRYASFACRADSEVERIAVREVVAPIAEEGCALPSTLSIFKRSSQREIQEVRFMWAHMR